MSNNPIVFISRNRIKKGQFKAFNEHYQKSLPAIETGKPDTLAQLAFVDEDSLELVLVRLFADADSLDFHLQGADQRSQEAYKYVEPVAIEILGSPNEATLEMMKQIAGSGIAISVQAGYLGGFMRFDSE